MEDCISSKEITKVMVDLLQELMDKERRMEHVYELMIW